MPELPEVETIVRALKKQAEGSRIDNIIVKNSRFRDIVPDNIDSVLCGAKIIKIRRVAKYIVIDLNNDKSIIWHLGMSGRIIIYDKLPAESQKHDHIFLILDNCCLVFNDARRFGLFTFDDTERLATNRFLKNCGIDPFSEKLNAKYLYEQFQSHKKPIKVCLLEQSIINGIGNIYASEILFDCGISPLRSADSLSEKECENVIISTRKILQKSIDAGGSTLKDYRHLDGNIGHFQDMHCVYNKTGLKCPNCCCNITKTGGIQKIIQAGRSTFFCKTKQK